MSCSARPTKRSLHSRSPRRTRTPPCRCKRCSRLFRSPPGRRCRPCGRRQARDCSAGTGPSRMPWPGRSRRSNLHAQCRWRRSNRCARPSQIRPPRSRALNNSCPAAAGSGSQHPSAPNRSLPAASQLARTAHAAARGPPANQPAGGALTAVDDSPGSQSMHLPPASSIVPTRWSRPHHLHESEVIWAIILEDILYFLHGLWLSPPARAAGCSSAPAKHVCGLRRGRRAAPGGARRRAEQDGQQREQQAAPHFANFRRLRARSVARRCRLGGGGRRWRPRPHGPWHPRCYSRTMSSGYYTGGPSGYRTAYGSFAS